MSKRDKTNRNIYLLLFIFLIILTQFRPKVIVRREVFVKNSIVIKK